MREHSKYVVVQTFQIYNATLCSQSREMCTTYRKLLWRWWHFIDYVHMLFLFSQSGLEFIEFRIIKKRTKHWHFHTLQVNAYNVLFCSRSKHFRVVLITKFTSCNWYFKSPRSDSIICVLFKSLYPLLGIFASSQYNVAQHHCINTTEEVFRFWQLWNTTKF